MAAETLSPQDLSLLARPLYGFFSTAAGASPPQPRPVWFEVTSNGHIQLFTGSDTPKVHQLRRDPRASLVVAAPVGERERWVSVAGPTTLASDGAWELVERLAARYWDLDDPIRAQDLAQMRDEAWLRVIIEPETVRRYAM
ncbi:pyridoxamine 5'-phosphate oxidase family protein [Mycobacterium crocinum]|uniref:Pyridoxamine 5'-phosphate oxidase family protein n=1 Tax=Mycolicibacterium crocinum TaxID=388459 RepID=A0ABY3TVB2_9MYCO|nr:pyridoxamine 5'-phosphate oxidase family protein [Mycolicibacterium crocinum]MCV7218517.1 pyridoxamine 5'-phosphate oxidase family protein [Mycolicibacterium crocinum]ULN43979.1 pyridoxamine 5'-phosphate oxidase family protein [Mycolicibacterium crocinum]